MVAAVRSVTQATVLRYRRMFPQEGATLLGMTGITGVIDRGLGEEEIVIAIVCIMTVGAGHRSKTQWMTACPE